MTSRVKGTIAFSVILIAILLVLALGYMYSRGPNLALSAVTDPILEIHNDSLTTWLPADSGSLTEATKVQKVRPTHRQRGVGIDGTLRAPPALPIAFAGNPFGGSDTAKGIRESLGTFETTDIDISLAAEGMRWIVGRSYNARQEDNGAHYDSDSYQGWNWQQLSQPEILFFDHASDNAKDMIYLVYGADRYVEYKRVSSSSNYFKAKNGAAGVFTYSSGSPDTYMLTDMHSNKIYFFGFNTSSNTFNGQFWKFEDPAGNKAYIGDSGSAATAISNGFNATNGWILKAYDSYKGSGGPNDVRRYTYAYSSSAIGSTKRLESVTVETKTGGTWSGSPTGLSTVAKVEYFYYTADDDHGKTGDLKIAKVTDFLGTTGFVAVKKKYYRYWRSVAWSETAGANFNPGYAHQIKMIVGFEGTRSYDWLDSNFDEDFLSASDDALKEYADAYFEYTQTSGTDKTIAQAFFSGDCGCGGSSDGTHSYTYEANGSYSDGAGYDDTWANRTIVERPHLPDDSDSWLVLYFDEAGQPLSSVLADGTFAGGGTPSVWATELDRDSAGIVTRVATPASVDTYIHSTGAISLEASAGLVRHMARVSSGVAKGYLEHAKFSTGSGGTQYLEQSLTYDTAKALDFGAPAEVSVFRPYISKRGEYPTETTNTADAKEWDYTTTVHASTLATKQVTTDEPAVTTAKNGPNSRKSTSLYFKTDGTLQFSKDQSLMITYRVFLNGLLTSLIEDANTTSLSPPSGFSHTGTPFDRSTQYVYDAQGRLDRTDLADGRKLKKYYTRLADHRLVTLAYNGYDLATPTYYGPISYTVSDHRGNPTVSAIIELANNSSTATQADHIDENTPDPILAAEPTSPGIGQVTRMTTRHYGPSGAHLEASRAYFLTPSAGDGSSGTNYDERTYTYDNFGHMIESVDPTGTIRASEFDIDGKIISDAIGTVNGGGGDNMVTTMLYEYDSGAVGGNRLLTSVIRRVQDGATDERETTYAHDVRGRVLLATNPTAPHALYKYNNFGQVLEMGLYSSTGSITVGTDYPSTETTNRLALTETQYDELRRPWEVKRHNINDSNGSSTDSILTSTWYDSEGRVAKIDGEQLQKFAYDRLDRRIHSFILQSDNDSGYSAMLDVTGDTVLEQSEINYHEDHDAPLMTAQISRKHNDASTTGALDTNADGDVLKYTNTNVLGRIQITGTWYDSLLRPTDVVQLGTYSDATFDRGSTSSPPSRSDTALRSTYTYNDAGDVSEVADPKNLTRKTTFDEAGRVSAVVDNYTGASPTDPASDKTITYSYGEGLMVQMIVDYTGSSNDQITAYTYGSVRGADPGESVIATGHLLSTVAYPDTSGGSDVVSYAYNAQSQVIWQKDQAGNVLEYTFDTSGRSTDMEATTISGGFDATIDEIELAYTSLGQVSTVSQKGSGTCVDQVKYTYDGWGNSTNFEQDHNSAVSGGGDQYIVTSAFAKNTTGRNTIRRTSLTYDSGKVLTFNYDSASRVSSLSQTGTTLATYTYLGFGNVVKTYYDQPDVFSSLYNLSSNAYQNLDVFNRVISWQWTKDLGTDRDFYDVDIAYDRNSNINWINDQVHGGHDVSYTNDALNRLTRSQEGTFTVSPPSFSANTRDQQWTLTLAATMGHDKLDLNGDSDFADAGEYDDSRSYTKANELDARSAPVSCSLAHDAVGNMTSDGTTYTYLYDVFGRLVKVTQLNSPNKVVANYKYNGLGYRIQFQKDTDADGDADGSDLWYHLVYDESWRHLATYRSTDNSPKEEFYHNQPGGSGRIGNLDALLFRDKDANIAWTAASDGNLEQRYYYCQNWRNDVSVIVESNSFMVEWIKYSSYGVPFAMPAGDAEADDGDCDLLDLNQIMAWKNASAWDARGDLDLDGDVDINDHTRAGGTFFGTTLGHGVLSATGVANRRGYAGYEWDKDIDEKYHVRFRVLAAGLGQWMRRDPLGYRGGENLYSYVGLSATIWVDPYGLVAMQGSMEPSHDRHYWADRATLEPQFLQCEADYIAAMNAIACPHGTHMDADCFYERFADGLDYALQYDEEYSETRRELIHDEGLTAEEAEGYFNRLEDLADNCKILIDIFQAKIIDECCKSNYPMPEEAVRDTGIPWDPDGYWDWMRNREKWGHIIGRFPGWVPIDDEDYLWIKLSRWGPDTPDGLPFGVGLLGLPKWLRWWLRTKGILLN